MNDKDNLKDCFKRLRIVSKKSIEVGDTDSLQELIKIATDIIRLKTKSSIAEPWVKYWLG